MLKQNQFSMEGSKIDTIDSIINFLKKFAIANDIASRKKNVRQGGLVVV